MKKLPHKVFFNRVEDGSKVCSYVPQVILQDILRTGHARQWWKVLGNVVSLRLAHGGMVKRWEKLVQHVLKGEDAFLTLIDECAAVNVHRPSSYSDIFAQRFRSPAIPHTVNALLSPGFAGAWQQALKVGKLIYPLRKYDINSAYLWGLINAGLPDPHTFRFTRDYIPHYRAVYLIQSPGVPTLPYPFSQGNRWALATDTEMVAYNLPPRLVVYGITWNRMIAQQELHDIVQTCPARKQVSQSYWGRWASRARIACHTPSKGWELRNPIRNLVWAHCIVSTVRLRVWLHSKNAVHVFVDSVITPDELPTGLAPGDWKLEKVYPKGLVILGPGMYGEPGSTLEKHCGANGQFVRTL